MKKLNNYFAVLLCLVMLLSAFGGIATASPAVVVPPDVTIVEVVNSFDTSKYDEEIIVGERAKGFMEYQGIPRMYEYYVPTTFTGKRMPIMMMIPGSGGNSDTYLRMTHYIDVAEEMGFVVVVTNPVVIVANAANADVLAQATKEGGATLKGTQQNPDPYPTDPTIVPPATRYLNGSVGTTSGQTGSGDVRPNAIDQTGEFLIETISAFGIDDVGYTCAIVDRFVDGGFADKNRAFVSGLSHGAYMTLRLAAERPDVFAGAASVAGLLDVGHQTKLEGLFDPITDNQVKLVFIQGDADAIVPPGEQLKTNAENIGPDLVNDGNRPLFDIKGDPPSLYGNNLPGGSEGLEETIDWFMLEYGLGSAHRTGEYDVEDLDVTLPGSTTGLKDITDVWRYEYNDGAAIVYWVKGGGHSWPGNTAYSAGSARTSTQSFQIDATRVIMEDLWIELNESVEASIVELEGNKNELTITITKEYDNGKTEVITETFEISNNTAGVYQVDDYKVYVDTKGTQIRDCYIIEDGVDDGRAHVSLSGDVGAMQGEDLRYVVSVSNVDKLATATLWFEVEDAYFVGKDFNGLNSFTKIGDVLWTKSGDKWIGRATIANYEGGVSGTDELDIFEMLYTAKEEIGTTAVKITRVELSGYNASNEAVFIKAAILNGSVTAEIGQYYSKYDVNRDKKVDQLDLTTAQLYYTAKAGDANWSIAQKADVDGSGLVDIADLILILNNIVW